MWKLLVVEDDEFQLNACINKLKLSTFEYQIDEARNVEEAKNKLNTNDYDLVITDLRLPTDDYEGFSVIKEVKKKDPTFERTKIIVWTIVGAEEPEKGLEAIKIALRFGISDYIIKDMDRHLDILDITIQKVLQEAKIKKFNKGQVFINSPYDKHHDKVYNLIKKNLGNLSYAFIRGDDHFSGGVIRNIIFDKISESEFIISFISGANSNVMYELGLAHGLNKKVIIVKDDKTNTVTDIKGSQYIEYKRSGLEDLVENILLALENFSPEI